MALVTRRGFAGFWPAAVIGGEFALARAARGAGEPMVSIDSNENPDGPPEIALKVMRESLSLGGRYHFEATEDLETELGRGLGLKQGEVLAGAGSSEILHAAIDVFTSATRPVVVSNPTYEACPELARALGRPSEKVPLTPTYAADVEKMAAVARAKKAGLVYLCNPNNPTGSATPQDRIKWLSENLPGDCVLLVDEAYLDFSPQLGSAVGLVKAGRNVVVARTFSKIWGMAGLRVGYGCARSEYINKMAPFRDMVLNVASARGALAAIKNSGTILPQRRAKMTKLRGDVCTWLHGKGFDYIEPYGNFVMIQIKRPVRPVIQAFASHGVSVGRPFPPYEEMLRVTMGTEHEMDRFRAAFTQVFS